MFSLIVTTQGHRLEEVERFLNSLKKQNDYELILVDQSDGSNVEELFNNFAVPGKCVKSNGCVSLSKARNIGLEHARGDYYAFPDDDCWYPDGLLDEVKLLFEKTHADGICINAYDPILNKPLLIRQLKKDSVEITQWNALKYPISIGIFVKRNDIFFDEELGVGTKWGAGEESDYILKMLSKKKHIVYFKNTKVYHPYINELDKIDSKSYRYGQGYGALVKKAIRRKQYAILADYSITIVRSIGGALYYKFTENKQHRKYIMRVKGMINGLIKS